MADIESTISLILTGVGILITLIVPLPIKDEYRLFIITSIVFIVIVILLSRFDEKLNNLSKEVNEVNKRFKTIEELNDIRLDIRELKRRIFNNE
jgi:hypothetical protein